MAAASALATGLTAPAGAAPGAPVPAHAPASPVPAPGTPGPGWEIDSTSRPVAPGATLTSFDRLAPDKWLRADALSVDLEEGTRVDHLSGAVSERRTLGEHVAAHDPGEGRRTVAAINADFFDINATGAPLGPGVRNGDITQSPEPGATQAVGFGPGSAGRVLDLYFEGTLTLPDGEEPLAAYNAADVPQNGIGAYNAQWGDADRTATVEGAAETAEVAVRDGRVVSVSEKPGDGAVPPDTTALLGRDAGAEVLAGLKAGDPVSWEYDLRTGDGGPLPRTAVGGRGILVLDGEPQDWEGRPNNTTAPRTAVGFSRDGSTLHVLTVDGRQAASGGVTLTELARMMDELGAYNALNLDGGGSSTLLAREPGSDTPQLENAPSDGEQREVPNGLALTAPDGSGDLRGFRVETAADPALAPTADPVPGGHPERVFPGLTRQLTAAGYDETYGPAEGDPDWRVHRRSVGRVDDDGTFLARRTGSTEVTARRGRADGSVELRVLGELRRVTPTRDRVGLATPQDEGTFGVLGFDADGTSAPVDPADVELEYDRALFAIAPDATTGGFTVLSRSGEEGASGTVKATVAGHSTVLAVTVGLRDQRVAAFDDAGDWTFSAARAEGSVAPEPSGRDGQALRLDYDFGQSTATRAAYVNPPQYLEVPGQPQAFTLWVEGDGRGAWPSLHLVDANGTSQVLRGPHVTWEGWRQVTFTVPEGVAYPLKVRRFYVAETRPDAQYSSSIVLDELVARTPPDVELPAQPAVRDRLITTARDVAGRDWRFAVMSDAQFVAREPDSELVAKARRTLREIRAADPDFVVVNGDLVDEGSPEDLAFARQVLEDELGDAVPWYYVPGNHEVMGGSIDAFVAEFGPARRTFDHEGTRFVTLDTSSLSLGGLEQFAALRGHLDAAARDRRVRSVAVVQHVPPRDPTPQRASRLTDRLEADLLEKLLSAFHARSGKDVLFVGSHVGVFHASRVNGVSYLVNGNAGKNPAAPPGEGGFTGWSLVGVERDDTVHSGREAFAVQTRAHVDGLTLQAPDALPDGATDAAGATVRQGEGAGAGEVPVAWPVSADWSGSRNLCLGDGRPKRRCDAAFDPATGVLTALRPGTVSLAVEVNGARAERTVVIG
ncbi:phosphodiester glycosidase family protein [Streptomyces sp. DSM 42041]|uniref:Phosphodiester glycosidase family protein n=1 Tax=Streptomyces hazeniae TaxID=3075538 RepID=A0ABU2NSE3_9ACTN|nr:phosphodiester glycosidase family protein [Streptomyces sp. DSM 42041]MDT0379905.1 phosphodiester glycosidase family protein [Streptomyces sp. DSM 42041]